MKKHTNILYIYAAALLTAAPLSAATGALQATATKLSQAHSDATVWISVNAKINMSTDGDAPQEIAAALSKQQESTVETTGTFISSDGLIVTALTRLDQSTVINGQTINTAMGPVKIKSESKIASIKVTMADGVEIPADLVLKDKDLGLAFIKLRPEDQETKDRKITFIDIANSASGKLLDDCIVIGRHGGAFDYQPSVSTAEISSISTKPRTTYNVPTTFIGSPVFLSTGKLLGITVDSKPSGDAQSGQPIQLFPIVLPAADVAKVAAQAKEIKPRSEIK